MTDTASKFGQFTRRRFLQTAGCGALACAASPVLAGFDRRSVSFLHTHTGEHLEVVYYHGGNYDQAALLRVAYTLRDFRNNDVHTIDPMLLDALFELQVRADHDKPYQVISAYRSPKTNAALRKTTTGVAEHSMHMEGRAIDIRVAGISTKKLRDLALAMQRGGVGYYPDANFIHVDTGRIRTW